MTRAAQPWHVDSADLVALQEVVDGIVRIQRLGLEKAGNRINAFRPEG